MGPKSFQFIRPFWLRRRSWNKADETGSRRLTTETTSPELEPLRIDLLLFAKLGCTHAVFGVLVDERTPIALSLFSVVHRVSSCIYRRDHNLCRTPPWKMNCLDAHFLQTLSETKRPEQYLEKQQTGERSQFLVFEADHANFVVFSLNFCFTGLHLRWPPRCGLFWYGKSFITAIHGAPQAHYYFFSIFFMQL